MLSPSVPWTTFPSLSFTGFSGLLYLLDNFWVVFFQVTTSSCLFCLLCQTVSIILFVHLHTLSHFSVCILYLCFAFTTLLQLLDVNMSLFILPHLDLAPCLCGYSCLCCCVLCPITSWQVIVRVNLMFCPWVSRFSLSSSTSCRTWNLLVSVRLYSCQVCTSFRRVTLKLSSGGCHHPIFL